MFRGIFACFLLLWTQGATLAQSISGVINDYTEVTAMSGENLTVSNASTFTAGDRVLLIQMKGAEIDTSSNSNYGNLNSLAGAGSFEFSCIAGITGNVITLSTTPDTVYSPGQGLQLVRVPIYNAPVVTGTLTATQWNGVEGGVLVLETPGILTLNANLDVSGRGFRGGGIGSGPFSCADANFFSPLGSGGQKGEGITQPFPGHEAARGKLANGGGGANRGDCGGGGGGNFGSGGFGGRIYSGCGPSPIRGVGGLNLTPAIGKAWLGGGGGGGYQDDGQPTAPGANGGGIVILIADTIIGNGNSILANGADVTFLTRDEGAGGGGGGGSVLLFANDVAGNLSVEVNGGDGGNSRNNIYVTQCHGPGGGGGGGFLGISLPALPAGLTLLAGGGAPGTIQNPSSICFNGSFQATAGGAGAAATGISLPAPRPSSYSLGPDSSLCDGDTITVDAGGYYGSFLWSDNSTGQMLRVANDDTIWVQATGACGPVEDTIIITIDTVPVVFLGPDTAVCAGDSILLNAGNGGVAYLWQDSSTTTQLMADSAGLYQVTVTDGNGCSSTDSLILSYRPLPVIDLGADTLICQGDSLVMIAGDSTRNYLWQNLSTDTFFTAYQSGQYFVTVTDSFGCVNDDSLNLVVAPLPQVNLGPDGSFCAGGRRLLDAGAGYPNYLWQNGNNSRTFQVTSSGVYSVTVTDANGCANADTAVITVHANPQVFLGNDTLLCPSETLALSPGPGYVNYFWSTGDLTPVISVTSSGNYAVEVEDTNGCRGTDTIRVFVGQLSVNIGPDRSICDGDFILLDPGPGYSSVSWQDGSTGRFYQASQAGQYIVTVTGGGGCAASDTMEILQVFQNPVISLGSDTVICIGDTLKLDAGGGYATYNWQDGSTDQVFDATTVGLFTVRVTDLNGCEGTDSLRILDRLRVPVVSTGNDRSFCAGDSAILVARPQGPWNFAWSTGETNDSIVVRDPGIYTATVSNQCGTASDEVEILPHRLPPTVSLGPDTFYCEVGFFLDPGPHPNYLWQDGTTQREFYISRPDTAWLTVSNDCGSSTDTILVLDGCPPPLFWPNAFTPNGDWVNDFFGPEGLDVENFHMVIFDRWQKIIFESFDQEDAWDGTYEGREVPEGVYIFQATYEFDELGQRVQNDVKGTITLIR